VVAVVARARLFLAVAELPWVEHGQVVVALLPLLSALVVVIAVGVPRAEVVVALRRPRLGLRPPALLRLRLVPVVAERGEGALLPWRLVLRQIGRFPTLERMVRGKIWGDKQSYLKVVFRSRDSTFIFLSHAMRRYGTEEAYVPRH
jgi:hypothetical protein